MAEAYATVAARGIHCNPVIISKITTRTGKNLEPLDANCQRVMDKDVADGVNKILKSVVDKGTGTRAKVFGEGDIAGKTGTINSNEAVWFAGYTPRDRRRGDDLDRQHQEPVHQEQEAAEGRRHFRGSGVKGYRVPSTGVVPGGIGQRRRRARRSGSR